eukprot:2699927-Amphidinium_carterae.1
MPQRRQSGRGVCAMISNLEAATQADVLMEANVANALGRSVHGCCPSCGCYDTCYVCSRELGGLWAWFVLHLLDLRPARCADCGASVATLQQRIVELEQLQGPRLEAMAENEHPPPTYM